MDLIDRYVNEIGRRLPRRQRDEVRQEIRSALLDALETRVDGKPTERDQIAVIKELGRPRDVAASYRPSDQYLIGPELYPIFKTVLGVVVLALVTAFVVVFALGLFIRPAEASEVGHRLLGIIDGAFGAILMSSAIVVLTFTVLQRLEIKPDTDDEDWEPRDLPVVRDHDLVSRGEAVAGIVFPAIFLAVLYVFRDRIGFVMTLGDEPVLNDVLLENLPWITASMLLGMALHSVLLWRGRWEWPTRIADFATDVFSVWVLYSIATDIAANESVLAETGLPAPLPAMIVNLAWAVVAIVGVMSVVEALKVVYLSIKAGPTGPVPQFSDLPKE
jgi:hypothetical protein